VVWHDQLRGHQPRRSNLRGDDHERARLEDPRPCRRLTDPRGRVSVSTMRWVRLVPPDAARRTSTT
jgi:hypothetical protein